MALRGLKVRAAPAAVTLRRNLLVFGFGGLLLPFPFIKAIDLGLVALGRADGRPRWATGAPDDPDALAAEFQARGVSFFRPLHDNSDDLRGFEIADVNGYVPYFGRPNPR